MLQKGKLYYSISEVAEEFNVETSALRYWESQFDILQPKTNIKGTRTYTQEDINKVKLIHFLLKEKKLTITGAQKHLISTKGGAERNLNTIESLQKIKEKLGKIKQELNKLEE